VPSLQLVLINVSDHFTRFKANGPEGAPPPTVIGCLLGVQDGRSVDVVNSFEMRFTQGEHGWDIDHPFLLKKQEQCEQGLGLHVKKDVCSLLGCMLAKGSSYW
jgi:COP9 signalosome complex subunit 6